MSFSLSYADIYLQQLGSLLIGLLGLLYFSKREKAILVLGFYGLNSVIFDMISIAVNLQSNIVGDIYTLTEALILLYFFYTLFTSPGSKRIIVVLIIAYCIFYSVVIFSEWPDRFSAIRMARDLALIGSSLLYFYSLMKYMPTPEITKYPMFWIVAAFIFFFAGTFVLSLSLDYLINVLKDDLSYLWPARNYFRFFFCLVVSYGLWLDLVKTRNKLQG